MDWRKTGRSILSGILILGILIALGIGGKKLIEAKKKALAAVPPAKIYGVVVPVRTTRETQVRLTIPYLAEVQSDTDVTLTSKITSRVKMILPAGTRVAKDQLIAELDAGDLLAKRQGLILKMREMDHKIRAKQLELENLSEIHAHNSKLVRQQVIPKEKFRTEGSRIESLKATIEGMKNGKAALKQNIAEIEDTLTYASIKSPIDGVISKTYVAEGGVATMGKPLLTLTGGKEKRLVVRVSDNIKPKALLKDGAPCPLHPLNSTFHGLDEYSCRIKTDLPAGSRTQVKLIIFTGKAILLPINGVLEINGKSYILAVSGDHAKAESVTIKAEGSEGLIVSGVKPGKEYAVAKPDILLKLMTGVRVIKAGRKG